MIRFNPNNLHTEYFYMRSCTSSLSGSAIVLDEERSTPDHEVFRKIVLNKEIVRRFIKIHKISKFVKLIPIAVTYYNDIPVALEGHPLGMAGEIRNPKIKEGVGSRWVSTSEVNIGRFIKPLTRQGEWYTDGYRAFQLNQKVINGRKPVSIDGKFCVLSVGAIKLMDMHSEYGRYINDRECIGYFTGDQYSISPPLWKSFDIKSASTDSSYVEDDFYFNYLDNYYVVNLHFALKAGKAISKLHGFEALEPLNLGDIMTDLGTVNLPAVDSAVQNTYDIGMKFTHAVAWLLGLIHRQDTIENVIAIRSLLRCLTTTGIARRDVLTEIYLFQDGFNYDSVPTKSLDDAKQVDDKSLDLILQQLLISRKQKSEINRVGNLHNADD